MGVEALLKAMVWMFFRGVAKINKNKDVVVDGNLNSNRLIKSLLAGGSKVSRINIPGIDVSYSVRVMMNFFH